MAGVSALPSRSREASVARFAVLRLVAVALRTRRSGDAGVRTGLGGTALLVLLFPSLLTPIVPRYILLALSLTSVLGLWSPFALSKGAFLLSGLSADAPAFLLRWSFPMALVLLAAARDAWSRRGADEVPDAR